MGGDHLSLEVYDNFLVWSSLLETLRDSDLNDSDFCDSVMTFYWQFCDSDFCDFCEAYDNDSVMTFLWQCHDLFHDSFGF